MFVEIVIAMPAGSPEANVVNKYRILLVPWFTETRISRLNHKVEDYLTRNREAIETEDNLQQNALSQCRVQAVSDDKRILLTIHPLEGDRPWRKFHAGSTIVLRSAEIFSDERVIGCPIARSKTDTNCWLATSLSDSDRWRKTGANSAIMAVLVNMVGDTEHEFFNFRVESNIAVFPIPNAHIRQALEKGSRDFRRILEAQQLEEINELGKGFRNSSNAPGLPICDNISFGSKLSNRKLRASAKLNWDSPALFPWFEFYSARSYKLAAPSPSHTYQGPACFGTRFDAVSTTAICLTRSFANCSTNTRRSQLIGDEVLINIEPVFRVQGPRCASEVKARPRDACMPDIRAPAMMWEKFLLS